MCRRNRKTGLIFIGIAVAVFVTMLLPKSVIIVLLCLSLILAGVLLFR